VADPIEPLLSNEPRRLDGGPDLVSDYPITRTFLCREGEVVSPPMRQLPRGTVTLLFTDIEGSTRLLHELGRDLYGETLREHQRLLRQVWERHHGHEIDTEGDAFFVAFARASDALAAAVDAQRVLAEASWPGGRELRVRIGVHSGEVSERGGKYVGVAVHRAARIAAAAHGGQVLASETARALCADEDVPAISLRDLGLHRLKDLTEAQHLYQARVDGLPSTFPPPRTLENRPTNLPSQPTPLIGREPELAELSELAAREGVRLLTLTGTGGAGKTRLALQLGAELIDRFEDGVYFVNLAALTDPALVLPTVAQTLGVREQTGEEIRQTLVDFLGTKRLLLVLDNFEQVIEAAGDVAVLLRETENLGVVVTSRSRLQLSGEHEYAVPALAERDAVALFAERAQAVKPGFSLDDSRAIVAEICARLDHLPLAIELAAARVKVLSEQALLERLGERLKLLTGGSRDLDERQRTLRAAIDWSYRLLDEYEQLLFRRLAAFAGGRTLEAIEAVCASDGGMAIDALEGVASLVDKSLLRQEEGPYGESRFVMLETIHDYARELLEASGEASDLRRRHADYFRALAERAGPLLRGAEQQRWIDILSAEQDNLRGAIGYLVETERFGEAQAVAAALAMFWETRGQFREAHEWFDEVLADREGQASPSRAAALFWAGRLALFVAEWERAGALLLQAVQAARELGDPIVEALALGKHGWVLAETGNASEGIREVERAIALARQIGDDWTTAELLNDGALTYDRTEPERTLELLAESLALRRKLGDRLNVADSLNNLGYCESTNGQAQLAEEHLQEGLRLAGEIGDLRHIALILGNLGNVSLFSGDYAAAIERYRECLRSCQHIGDTRVSLEAMRGIAAAAAVEGNSGRAATLCGAIDALHRKSGGTPSSAEVAMEAKLIAPVRERVGTEDWDAAAATGAGLDIDAAIEWAVATTSSMDTVSDRQSR
jgi:predicted ATPase/class 3 adenylate cyclase